MIRSFVCSFALVCLFACTGTLPPQSASAQAILDHIPMTNHQGAVYAIGKSGNTVYVGGFFDYLGPVTGAAALVDASSGVPAAGFPVVNGSVSACEPDGAGGWYIGGAFTKVGGKTRNNLAHVLADLSVDDAWVPVASGNILAMVADGSRVYAGGIGVRAYDATTGAQLFSTGNEGVHALALGGSSLYVGGSFSVMGGQSRSRLAAIDPSTGAALPWTSDIIGALVDALVLDGSTLYVGGQFTAIGGFSRNNIGAVDAASGATSLWNPNVNSRVLSLALGGGIVYAGGYFSMVGGVARNYLAAISTSSGLPTSWNPGPNGGVEDLSLSGGTIYAGGSFKSVGGQTRLRIAAIDAATGAATAWRPETNNTVLALRATGPQVFVGGAFASVGGKARTNLGAFDATTGAVTSWDPVANGEVRTIATTGSAVYVGGGFTSVGGQARSYLAALSPSTGLATAWNPGPDGGVFQIFPSGSVIYVGGSFSNCGGMARANLAAIDAASPGSATGWNPSSNGTVFRILLSGGLVYVGGTFTTIGGQSRVGLAALSPATGLANGWNPRASNIYGMTTDGSTLYVFGDFTAAGVGAPLRNRIAGIDMVTGFATSFDAQMSGQGASYLISGDIQFANSKVWVLASLVGAPVRFSGQERYLAELDPVTGAPTSYNAPYQYVIAAWKCPMFYDGTVLYLGGDTRLTSGLGPLRDGFVALNPSYVGVGEQDPPRALAMALGPSPTSGSTRIRLTLTRDSRVRVGVFDLQGREIARLADGSVAAGSREFLWDGATRSRKRQSGVYFVSAEAAGERIVRRIVVIR